MRYALVVCALLLPFSATAQDKQKATAIRKEIANVEGQIANLQKRLAALRQQLAKVSPAKPLPLDRLKVGQIGRVVYPSNVLREAGKPVVVQIDEIIDKRNMLVRRRWAGRTHYWWVEGVDTKGLVDDQDYTLKVIVQIGTKRDAGRTYLRLKAVR